MSDWLESYPLPTPPPVGTAVLRSRTLVWRQERTLTAVDASGARTLLADWDIYSHELTPDGRFVLALGDDAKRGAVWDVRTGRRVLDIDGDLEHRQSLRAGLVTIDDELFSFVNVRNKDTSIKAVHDGTERGWLATTGMFWFHVMSVVPIDEYWLAIQGYHDGEARDQIVVFPAAEALLDPMVLYEALYEDLHIREWGCRAAVGPAGPGSAVIFRDPEWDEDDEPPDDPLETFHGLMVWDLDASQVTQRIAYDGEVKDGATLGADAERIAVDVGGQVDVVLRASGEVRRMDAIALDPYRLEVAKVEGETITIAGI